MRGFLPEREVKSLCLLTTKILRQPMLLPGGQGIIPAWQDDVCFSACIYSEDGDAIGPKRLKTEISPKRYIIPIQMQYFQTIRAPNGYVSCQFS